MNCPNCGQELKAKTMGSIEVDECLSCKGVWFEEDELRKVKDQTDPDLNWMDFEIWKHRDEFQVATAPRKCPHCTVDMVTIKYAHTSVEVDYCVHCRGIWLDENEFQKIIEELGQELIDKSASEYFKASLEEAKEIIAGPERFLCEWHDFSTVIRMLQYRLLVDNPKLGDTMREIQRQSPLR